MDDESVKASRSAIEEDGNGTIGPASEVDKQPPAEPSSAVISHTSNGDVPNLEPGEAGRLPVEQDKNDSEAETVVLSGKEGQDHKVTKAIKLEDAGYGSDDRRSDVNMDDASGNDGTSLDTSRRASLKRKRGKERPKADDEPDGRESSALSSTASSPAPQIHSSKTSGSRSDRSRSSPPVDDDKIHGKLRKRTGGNEKRRSNNTRKAHDASTEPVDAQERRRETRSATHYDERSQRSDSPPARPKGRPRSTQSNHHSNQGVSKRRKPAPLHVEQRRRKASEDFEAESDDSSSVQSHHRLQMLHYPDGHVMSPAKISHKKNLDRSGRTLLARACMQGAEEARRWIRDRPQDINTQDHAGNTPLQIASLAGEAEVVALLLEAGCDTTCKNIDSDTPLIDAVENSHVEVVKLLLKAGVDPRQRNAKGQEPLELVNLDDDDADEIRDILLQARKEIDATRRQSEDHRHHGVRDADTPSAHASGASPTESNRSPPPIEIGGRRRTARSQPTNDALLWVNPTPQRLREEAGKGNIMIVDHILKMRPEANTDAVLAAVKGGHDDVLGLMIAIAAPDPDPEPSHSAGDKDSHTTPMLAAIGRGNLNIIQLLLDQPGFDPTRRLYKDMTYPEISEQRKGEHWEEESKMLRDAIDTLNQNGGRRSNTSSPRRIRTKRPAPKQESPEPSSSPHEIRKVRRPALAMKDDSDTEVKRRPSYQGTAVRQRSGGGPEGSTAASDRSSGRLGPPKPRLSDGRPGGDEVSGSVRPDGLKPKRKLMSGNDLKTDQEARRKVKSIDEVPADSTQSPLKPKSRKSFSNHDRPRSKPEDTILSSTKAKKAASEEPARTKDEGGKKRLRVSVSPQASRTDPSEVKKKKRQKVDPQGKAADQESLDHQDPPSPLVLNIVTSPTASKSPNQNPAPVAFMGTSSTPLTTKSEDQPDSIMDVGMDDASQVMPGSSEQESKVEVNDVDDPIHMQRQEAELATERIEAERLREERAEREREALLEKEEEEYKARLEREAEEAQIEALRQREEGERQAQMDREAEEARLAKAKRDEEMQRRRQEEEKQRREEQERRRREREERESQRRIRQQQEEERARLEALPNGLRRAAELGPEKARDSKEIIKWLPLRTVTTQELDPTCNKLLADELWIANIQAAPLLANPDLELSQCEFAWNRSKSILTSA